MIVYTSYVILDIDVTQVNQNIRIMEDARHVHRLDVSVDEIRPVAVLLLDARAATLPPSFEWVYWVHKQVIAGKILLDTSSRLSLKQSRLLEQYLDREKSIRQRLSPDSSNLRFNKAYLRASEIAEQYYCERKVEMTHIHGRVETETKRQGSEGHESLLSGSIEVPQRELLEKIFSGEQVIVQEIPLLGEHAGVAIAGQPDAVAFTAGLPTMVLEAKFSHSPLPYRSYHIQARVYGRILDSAGFDTSDLFYVIAVAPRDRRGDQTLFRKVIDALRVRGASEESLMVDGAHVYVYEYRQTEAVKDLDWAIEYWVGGRDAEPVDNSAKCRSCEYQKQCNGEFPINDTQYRGSKIGSSPS